MRMKPSSFRLGISIAGFCGPSVKFARRNSEENLDGASFVIFILIVISYQPIFVADAAQQKNLLRIHMEI